MLAPVGLGLSGGAVAEHLDQLHVTLVGSLTQRQLITGLGVPARRRCRRLLDDGVEHPYEQIECLIPGELDDPEMEGFVGGEETGLVCLQRCRLGLQQLLEPVEMTPARDAATAAKLPVTRGRFGSRRRRSASPA